MSRRQRQFNELRDLCAAGGVVRAIDLAFEHFAQFGRDDEIIDLLAGPSRRGVSLGVPAGDSPSCAHRPIDGPLSGLAR